jgi:hypothetical protein
MSELQTRSLLLSTEDLELDPIDEPKQLTAEELKKNSEVDRILQVLLSLPNNEQWAKIKHLEDWAYDLGLSDGREMDRGKALKIL